MHIKKVNGKTIMYCKSNKKSKKWMTVSPSGKTVYWGSPNMQDYTQHHDRQRRKSYRKRASGILLKDGTRAIDRKYSPAFYAYYVTW